MEGLSTVQVVSIVVTCCLVGGGVAAAIYFGYFRGHRLARTLIDTVGKPLHLTESNLRSSIWEENRRISGAAPYARPVAQGSREGIPVELSYEPRPAALFGASLTSITLLWPNPIARAGIDHYVTLDEPNDLIDRYPALGQMVGAEGVRRVNDDWLGPSYVWGSDAELGRILGPDIRRLLQTFPRRLAVVLFHDDAMVIKWFGMESDPAVVERAFALGLDCLQALAPRR